MQPIERNPKFSNPLASSTSPYLKQHAQNPVYWYPWGREALERAYFENKPIFLSIGYSTCYWCHVMEREVFENLSIASQMNQNFINIKVDREEHPELDEIYMIARQLLTNEGGWPNNVFLTPELKPFYAGGTYGTEDNAYGKPSFPRLLEWLHYSWTTQENEVRDVADNITANMQQYLVHKQPENAAASDIGQKAAAVFGLMKEHHDARSGGFFQAPKFPHECYLFFLMQYYESTGQTEALDMVTHSLGKMAAGGIQDHVGCGFHRYAVDKEWYVPHFEKMLYNQAMIARAYTDAARLTGNPYFADMARSVLEFVSGPLTDGNGAFYSALDAETNGVEGDFYAWTPEDIKELLSPEEEQFMVTFYALADIPEFPGHKHTKGKVIIARKPLDVAAREHNMPYVQLAAMAGQIMNKLLSSRNQRPAPGLDNKIIISWNALMIDAYAHAGKALKQDKYTQIAKRAMGYLLEHAIDNDGKLCRVLTTGRAQFDATLADYAYLIKALITLWRATDEKTYLESAKSLLSRADELFLDAGGKGYFATQDSERILMRIKNGDDSTLPGPNAVMLQNLASLYEITRDARYRDQAKTLMGFFLDGNARVLIEFAGMLQGALMLEDAEGKKIAPASDTKGRGPAPNDVVNVSLALFPADAQPGENCELIITLDIKDGWHINAGRVEDPRLVPTQVDVQGEGVLLVDLLSPEPLRKAEEHTGEAMLVYEGMVNVTARLRLAPGLPARPPIRALIRYQPCSGATCHAVKDVSLSI